MNFNDLDLKTKKELHEEVTQLATDIGGANVFLQMIEDIKKEQSMLCRQHPSGWLWLV